MQSIMCFWSNPTHINPNAMQELVVMLKHPLKHAPPIPLESMHIWKVNVVRHLTHGITNRYIRLHLLHPLSYCVIQNCIEIWNVFARLILNQNELPLPCAWLISWTRPDTPQYEDI